MDRNNWVFSVFQCAGCLLLNEESSVGIHIQFVVCSMCNGCVGRQQDLHAWVCMSPACSVITPLERDAFTSLKIWHRFRMLVKFECLKVGQTFCFLWGILWEAANALAKLHALCSVLNAFCLEEKSQIWGFFCAVPDIFAVSRIDQGIYHHVTCSIPYLHVQNFNLGTVNTFTVCFCFWPLPA